MSMEQSDRRPRIAVIGGGIAGLVAAHRLIELGSDRELEPQIRLYESSGRLGGAIETVRQEGYLIERGADSFLTKPAIVNLCERLGIAGELIPTDSRYRGALVLKDGRPIPVPEGFNLMAPAKLWPVIATPLLSARGKARLLAEAIVPKRIGSGDESLESFVRRRMGTEAFERLVQPLVSGIYTADPEKLSLAATLPRFIDMEREHGSLIRAMVQGRGAANGEGSASGARYGLFAGFRKGMEQLFSALRERVASKADVKLQCPVIALRRSANGWIVEAANCQPEEYGAIILAMPAHRAATLLANYEGPLPNLLEKIPYASSAIIVTGHSLSEVTHPLNAFGLVIPAIEKREVLAVSIASRKFPGRAPEGKVLLRTFVGGATRPEMLGRSDEELVAIVRKELASLLGVSGKPDVTLVTRYMNAMPQYHIGHLDLIKKIEEATEALPGLELTGSAYRGVGIPDVVADAERAAKSVLAMDPRESPPPAG